MEQYFSCCSFCHVKRITISSKDNNSSCCPVSVISESPGLRKRTSIPPKEMFQMHINCRKIWVCLSIWENLWLDKDEWQWVSQSLYQLPQEAWQYWLQAIVPIFFRWPVRSYVWETSCANLLKWVSWIQYWLDTAQDPGANWMYLPNKERKLNILSKGQVHSFTLWPFQSNFLKF